MIANGIDFDPYHHATQEDPYPVYAALRRRAPLYRHEGRDFYALSRHADVHAAMRDPDRFSSAYGDSLDEGLWGPNAREVMSIIAMDAPEHSRIRALVSKGFTPRRVAALQPEIRQAARRQLAPFLQKGEFDFVAAVGDIPVHVIAELIGIPPEDRADLLRMTNLMIDYDSQTGAMPAEFWDCAGKVIEYFKALIDDRRRHPRDDLATVMAGAEVDGERLSDEEIVAMLGVLNVAGNESTTKVISNAWYQAWRSPEQKRLIWAGAIHGWVEETLRHDNSAQLIARLLTTDTVLHGVTVPAGSRMVLLVSSANRDETVFDRAEEFDVRRGPEQWQKAIPFGSGPHFCLGAALARLTATTVLSELVSVVDSYSLDLDGATYVHSPNLRGFASLPTSVSLRA
ncbi:cytochrome P450 [Nonomuraea endophytica]|uniref:cytochrome P450 n=1 Tax=Nonomuraea endophytica TaxID=714136 RepID=UPI0037C50A2F